MRQNELLSIAVKIAAEAHLGQVDKSGRAYILHPIHLMTKFTDPELQQIAVLHDVVEDSNYYTLEHFVMFTPRVREALDCLTHREGESYDDYILRMSTNKDAILVKLEDLKHNSDITRLKGVRPKDLQRMEKYHKAFIYLKGLL